MTGNLVLVEGEDRIDPSEGMRLYEGERSTSERHLRARFVLDDGRELWFTDPRRFGEAFLIDDAGLEARFARLGVEPLSAEFTPEVLGERAAGRTAPLKSFLLDQSQVAGVGNIYADEALYRARLHPLSPAGSMKPEHHLALRDAVVEALEAGLERRRRLDRRLPRRPRREGRRCRTSSSSTPARASPARAAAGRSRGSSSPAARPTSARPARCACANAAPPPPVASHVRPAGQPRSVPGKTVKTEAVVLRSIRYGEADRILHLYSAARGRVNAIAKGVRKPRSRFGGRLEPFFRLDLVLHEGRSELLTVTNVSTVDGYPRLRSSARGPRTPAPAPATRSCGCSTRPSPTGPPTTCSAATSRCSTTRPRERATGVETALAFRLKLALAAGFAPELASCARCGEADHLTGFSGAAGRRRLRRLRGGLLPAHRGGPPLHGRGDRQAARRGPGGRGARPAPGRARGRRDARAPRARAAALPPPERPGPTAARFGHRRIGGRGGNRQSRGPGPRLGGRVPLRAGDAVLPGRAPRRGARQPAPHPLPARPRPHRPLEGVPPPQAQDPGLHRPRGRPLPDPPHPHAGGLRDRPHGRPRAGPQRGPDRGDRARPRPRPPALRPQRRGGARRRPARARRAAASSTTCTRCGSSTCSSATAPAST